MAFNIQFNAGATREAIARAIAAMEDATPMFKDIAEYMVDETDQRFQKGIAPDGRAWAPKKQSTLDRYKARGYGGQSLTRPLYLIGRLRRSVVRFATANSATIGSSVIYAGVMQGGAAKGAFGADRRGRPVPWGTIVARPIFGISTANAEFIVELADEFTARHLDSDG